MGGPAHVDFFISYAHRDAYDLAQRLHDDLVKQGFAVFLDRERLRGGDSWSRRIDDHLHAAKIVLALLSPASYESDYCRGGAESGAL